MLELNDANVAGELSRKLLRKENSILKRLVCAMRGGEHEVWIGTISDAQFINYIFDSCRVYANDANVADLLLHPSRNDPVELGAIALQRVKNNFPCAGH